MAKYITMPKLGLTMKEGKLTKWYVAEGMEFKTGDALYALETDKLANDIEAAENGFMIKHLLQEGENAPCLTPVAIIGNMNEDISELLKASGKEEIAEEPKESKKSGRIIASPAAKRLASERGIKIEDIIGSGPDGRITVDDVEAYGSTGKAKKSTPMASKIADKYNV
ncbi:MAG TPA: E3 binding domain-containing protein, partial [Candidatus Diapherotrites archaeon]|nr:E3 binding domain-containing protein [Candidatus Diapherotrites archaeon]